ncbi:MAG: hypothetical protein K6G30_01150 [Acetatifactor sp.]|nr:hypothetical protein [Acetatifactor sp.]
MITAKKVRSNAVNSIKHQNLVTQLGSGSDEEILALSHIDGAKDQSREKDALRVFLFAYAVLDDAKRHEMRVKFVLNHNIKIKRKETWCIWL